MENKDLAEVIGRKDADAIRRYLSGDPSAFDELFNRYWSFAFHLARSRTDDWDLDLAEDIAQESFVKILERIREIHSPEAFRVLLRQTVLNTVKDYWKISTGRAVILERLVVDAQQDSPDEESVQVQMVLGLIKSALAKLPKRRRRVLLLKAWAMSHVEIAKKLSTNVGVTKMELVNARRFLAAMIEQHLEPEVRWILAPHLK